MDTRISTFAQQTADRDAIRHCLFRYCRGVDRLDETMVRSAFWPDGIATFGTFSGNVEEFIPWAWSILKSMDQTQHSLSNMLIEVTGDRAAAESHLYAYHRKKDDRQQHDVIVGARYLTNLERRDDEWRITRHRVVQEWFRDYPDTGVWDGNLFGTKIRLGSRDAEDPSYTDLF